MGAFWVVAGLSRDGVTEESGQPGRGTEAGEVHVDASRRAGLRFRSLRVLTGTPGSLGVHLRQGLFCGLVSV